ncbi:DUF4403 family protein [Pontibacter liquoris]|uniref:DUF4403 family protein n=1 Tax=Pontibacter liquoris TaxID=2905677 RepID=UPI001FA6C999|nr:DUF4403 family protein [Pontibacter liquoris]
MDKPVQLNVPVSVSYAALEGVMQQQLVGMYIPQPEEGAPTNPYARVLDVRIAGSKAGANIVLLRVQLQILRTVLKRDKVAINASVALGYDNAKQQVYVQQFSMASVTSSSFYNTALEVLINKVAYHQIIDKARVDLRPIISAELEKVNDQLAQGWDLKGLTLTGTVEVVDVQDIAPKPDYLSLRLLVQGNLEVAVQDLSSFLPPTATEV